MEDTEWMDDPPRGALWSIFDKDICRHEFIPCHEFSWQNPAAFAQLHGVERFQYTSGLQRLDIVCIFSSTLFS